MVAVRLLEDRQDQRADATIRERAERLCRAEIDFIPNRGFAAEGLQARDIVLAVLPTGSNVAPRDLPPHLRRMCETNLLSHEHEATLFREMNLLKFQANAMRSRLNPAAATEEELAAIESRITQAQAIRDHIIGANMRLVMSIVKKFITPQHSFDEMLSDGIVTLMQAVEKFDYDQGFRFSTYAYRSIARTAYRKVTSARAEQARFTRDAEGWACEQESSQSSSSMTDQVWSKLRELMALMLQKLDRREQFIIRSRYALGAHRSTQSFQYLADKLGVSKERARQLERRAVGKLQSMAGEFDMDALFGASMV